MKFYLIALFCFLGLVANAQKDTSTYQSKVALPMKDGQIIFEEIISLDSTFKANTLYKAAKTWFVNNFNSEKSVIQSEDQMNGRFLGKATLVIPGVTLFNNPITPMQSFNIQIDVKDGKYRYRFYNLASTSDFMDNTTTTPLEKSFDQYLKNSNKKGLISRNEYNKRADKAFNSLKITFMDLADSLKKALNTAKNDDF